jgi:hypothetical protein
MVRVDPNQVTAEYGHTGLEPKARSRPLAWPDPLGLQALPLALAPRPSGGALARLAPRTRRIRAASTAHSAPRAAVLQCTRAG